MSQRVKVLVSVLLAVVVLTVGGAATVMAQDEPTQEEPELAPSSGANGLLARVAEILGISQEELVNAFEQSRQEMREETFISHLDKAVEKGLITQDEADEIKDWWLSRPEAVADRFCVPVSSGLYVAGSRLLPPMALSEGGPSFKNRLGLENGGRTGWKLWTAPLCVPASSRLCVVGNRLLYTECGVDQEY
jgi:hypothetical protein